MSTTIDDRVVQMRFDNRDFEKNVAATMSTLDKFKAKLKFKGVKEDFDQITKAANSVSLKSIEQQVDNIENKFSVMGIAVYQIVSRMTNRVIDSAERMVKSLSIGQVTEGFNKYESKLASVQKIMNATGESIETVQAQLDKLMWYTDETSYSFTQMTDSIGMFTNAGIDLQTSVKAMQGINNWAGLTGATVDEANRAMYNLSQAIGANVIQLMDWKSVMNANMADKTFKEKVLENAAAMGELQKVSEGVFKTLDGKMEVTAANFQNTLQKRWFTGDVLLKTLDEYSAFSETLYKYVQKTGIGAGELIDAVDEYRDGSKDLEQIAQDLELSVEDTTEVMSVLGDESLDFGRKAFKSGQQTKTFQDAINAVKDAVSTGWMKTWEIIIGDAEQAKEVWGAVVEELLDIFNGGTEARNQMLKEWAEGGGRDAALEAISIGWAKLRDIVAAVKKEFRNVFPKKTSSDLIRMTKAVRDFVKNISMSDNAIHTLKRSVEILANILKAVSITLKTFGMIAFIVAGQLFKLADSVLGLLTDLTPLKNKLREALGDARYEKLAGALTRIVERLKTGFISLIETVTNLFSGKDAEGKVIADEEKSPLIKFFSKLMEILSVVGGFLLDALIDGLDALSKFDFKPIISWINDGLDTMWEKLKKIGAFLAPVGKGFKNFFGQVTDGTVIQGFATSLFNAEGSLKNFSTTFKKVKNATNVTGFMTLVKNKAMGLSSVFEEFGETILGLFEKINPAKILVASFGTALTGVLFTVMDFTKAAANFTNSLTGIGTGIGTALKERIRPSKVKQIATALTVLAGALIIMSFVDSKKLMEATKAMLMLVAGLAVFSAATAAINKFLIDDEKMLSRFKDVSKNMLILAGAVAVLAAGLAILGTINTKGLLGKVLALGAIMAGLAAFAIALAKWAPVLSKNSFAMISYAGAVYLIVLSLQKIASVDMEGIVDNIGALAVIITSLIGISIAAKASGGFSGAMGIIALVIGLKLFVWELKSLAEEDIGKIAQGLFPFVGLMSILGIIMRMIGKAGKNAHKLGVAIAAIGVSMMALSYAVRKIGELPIADAVQGGAVVAALLGVMTLIIKVFKEGKNKSLEHADKIGKAILKMSVAIGILSLSLKFIGSMDTKEAIQGGLAIIAFLGMFALITKAAGKDKKAPTGAIVAMTFAIGMITTALMMLTLIDKDEVMNAAQALTLTLIGFAIATNVLNDINFKMALKQAIIMGLVIGELSLGLKYISSVGDWQSIIAAGGSLSLAIIAFGAAMKLLNNVEVDPKSIGSTLAIMTVMIIEIGALFAALNEFDIKPSIEAAAAIGIVMVALGASIRLMGELPKIDWKQSLALFGGMSAVLIAAAGAFWIMKDVPTDGLILKATAIGEVALAMGATMLLISKFFNFNTSWGDFAKPIVAMVVTLFAIAGSFKLLEGIDGNAMQQQAIALGMMAVVLEALVGVAYTMAKVGKVLNGGALGAIGSAGLAVAEVIGIMLLILGTLGVLVEAIEALGGDPIGWINKAGDLMEAMGGALGKFVGGIIGGIGEGLADSLVKIGEKFTEFKEVSAPFFEWVETLAQGQTLAGVGVIVNAIKNLMDTSLGQSIGDLFGDSPLEKFSELVSSDNTIVPNIKKFFNDLGSIGEDKVKNAAAILDAIGTLCIAIDESEDAFDILGDTEQMNAFGEGLAKFGEAAVGYNDAIAYASINETLKKKTNIIADCIDRLTETLPDAKGTLGWFFSGTEDIGTFGASLEKFGSSVSAYNDAISGITDEGWDNIEKSAAAGKLLGAMSKTLPSAQGTFMNWFNGTVPLDQFGTQLVAFGVAMRMYYQTMKGINFDDGIIDASATAAKTLTAIADSCPDDTDINVLWGLFTYKSNDSKSFEEFTANLAAFGKGMYLYYCNIANIKPDIVTASANAGMSLVELAKTFTDNSSIWDSLFGNTIENFGTQITSLGSGFNEYYKAIESIDFGKVDNSIDSATNMLDFIMSLSEMESVNTSSYVRALYDLADAGISGFTSAFEESDEQVKEIGKTIVSRICDGVKTSYEKITVEASNLINTFVNAVSSKKEDISDTIRMMMVNVVTVFKDYEDDMISSGKTLMKNFETGIKDGSVEVIRAVKKTCSDAVLTAKGELQTNSPSKVFYDVGGFTTEGFVNAVYDNIPVSNRAMSDMANGVIDTANDVFDILGKKSKVFSDIGNFVMAGLQNGIEGKRKNVNDAMTAMSKGMLSTTQEFWQINSPSVTAEEEIGHYIIEGVAEGITSDMSAEEAAQQKAQNIVDAFQTEFDRLALQMETHDLAYELWTAVFGDSASEEELKAKAIEHYEQTLESQASNVRIAHAEWQAMIEQFGESSQKAQESYNKYLSQNIEMAKTAKEYLDTINGETSEGGLTVLDRVMEFQAADNAYYEKLIADGMEKEEALEKLKERQNAREPILQSLYEDYIPPFMTGEVGSDVEAVMDKWIGDYEISLTWKTAKATSKATSKGIQDAFSGEGDSVMGKLTEFVTRAAGGEDLEGLVGEYGTGIIDTLAKYVSKLPDAMQGLGNWVLNKLRNAGIAVPQGYAQGINDGMGLVVDSVTNLGELSEQTMRDVTHTNSPSKDWIELAHCLIEGLCVGLTDDDAKKMLKEAMEYLSDFLLNKQEEGINIAKTNGQVFMQAFSDGVKSGVILGQQAILQAINNAVINALSSVFEDIGNRLGGAISMGIANTIPGACATANGLLQVTINAAYTLTNAVQNNIQTAINMINQMIATAQAALAQLQSMASEISAMVANAAAEIASMKAELASLDMSVGTSIDYTNQLTTPQNGMSYNDMVSLMQSYNAAQSAASSGAFTTTGSYITTNNYNQMLISENGKVRTATAAETYRNEKMFKGNLDKMGSYSGTTRKTTTRKGR